MPITRGHVLLTPRQHREKLSHCKTSEAAVLGAWLGVLSRAVMRGVGALALGLAESDTKETKQQLIEQEEEKEEEVGAVQDWNVVQNNGIQLSRAPHEVKKKACAFLMNEISRSSCCAGG